MLLGSVLFLDDLKPNSIRYAAKVAGQADKPNIRRMVVVPGPVAHCIKRFIILDFTGKEALVAERFGYNPAIPLGSRSSAPNGARKRLANRVDSLPFTQDCENR